MPSSSFATARSRCWWRPKRPAKASIFSAATSCSTTTFRGTPTGWNSGWAASIATARLRDCLIFNFVATNTVEGHILDRLHGKARRRSATRSRTTLFSTSSARSCPPLRSNVSFATTMRANGRRRLEDRLLRDVSEDRFRAICQNALEGLAIEEAQPADAGRAPRPGPGASRRARDHRPLHGAGALHTCRSL